MKIDWKKLILSFAITWVAGGIGSLFTYPAIGNWYASLNKPPVTPPNWLFGPMWTVLYTIISISLYLFWVKSKKLNNLGGRLFIIQISLNLLWSIAFFGAHSIVGGLVTIIFLWFFTLANLIEFKAVDKQAGYLLLPYLAWLTAATVLNLSIAFYNP